MSPIIRVATREQEGSCGTTNAKTPAATEPIPYNSLSAIESRGQRQALSVCRSHFLGDQQRPYQRRRGEKKHIFNMSKRMTEPETQ